ncbi:hypothetical protein BCR35DRAFT_295832 [Leucosporidium creatinivorum]|uniref:Fascin-like domain-containing protein n=1 Tax=Leucosporidium creatinivorum TaxID=106004 RepID=A0A1Y2DIN6_9BASI|nr:hypothetical protein BCR35DRAFT_295832 [Leucosporidium creatinivorum]
MGKLTFKGEAPKKKKKKVKSVSTPQEEEEELSGWMSIPSASLALGPTYLTLPSTSLTAQPICLALQPTTGKIYPFPIPPSSSAALAASAAAGLEQEELEAIVEAEAGSEGPSDVNHVWVCTRIPDTMNTVTFRSGSGKFLAVDELGVVSAEREARGVQEEFTLEEAKEGRGLVVIKSSYGKYLSVDVLAGGKMELRADENEEGETERWRVWMQGEYLAKAKKQLMERSGVKAAVANDGLTIVGDVGAAEKDLIQKYQARGQGRYVGSAEDKKELKRARNEGKLGEAMLERRVKLKSDRYC